MDTFGWKFSGHEYMTQGDRDLFKRYRDTGHVTFYRAAACEKCSKEVAKGKRYCSKACYDASQPKKEADDAEE